MARDFIFDPRDLIGGPFGRCPQCQVNEFGTLHIVNNHITRRCRQCWHTASEQLPPLKKAVIYLDQCLLSNIAKSLDPVWGEERGAQDEFWTKAFDALDRALKLQLIVCPESRIHQRESIVHRHFVILRRLYEHFALDAAFKLPTLIHQQQLLYALRAVLSDEEATYDCMPRDWAIDGELDDWMALLSVRVHLPAAEPDQVLEREIRDRSGQEFEKIFERWAQENKTFDEYYEFERRGHAETIVLLLREHFALLERVRVGEEQLSEDVWNPRLEVDVALNLVRTAQSFGMDSQQATQFVLEFLYSEDALRTPLNNISALLMAALARRASMGQRQPPSRGMWNDITAISAFLPYCDAMFVDNECAELLREGPLNTRIPYTTKVFSKKTGEDFLSYLAELEQNAGSVHFDWVIRTYGESWLEPFRTILQHERNQQENQKAGKNRAKY